MFSWSWPIVSQSDTYLDIVETVVEVTLTYYVGSNNTMWSATIKCATQEHLLDDNTCHLYVMY